MPFMPLLRSLNLWHVFFSTRQRTLDFPDITQMRNTSDTAKDPADSGIGKGATTSANTTTPLPSQIHDMSRKGY